MARKFKEEQLSGQTILLVDDNLEYLEATKMLLEREGHKVLTASDGPSALIILRQQLVDLLLLDYFMPGMTGEEVVTRLRQFNKFVQVILQTGYSSESPPREVMRRLDIQGYHDKSEGPTKLLLWVDVGLKAAYTVQLLQKSRQGLRYILEATPDLHKIQPLEDLLQGILLQISGLMGVVNSFLAILPTHGLPARTKTTPPDGFLVILEEDADLIIRAATGRYAEEDFSVHSLETPIPQLIKDTMKLGQIQEINNITLLPLRVAGSNIGVIYLDRKVQSDQDIELLKVFANQAAVAIHNAQLYEMATLDPLTGVYVRRFFEQCLLRELRTAFRSRQSLSIIMMDVDGMKQINDSAGHQTGDQALTMIGKVLHQVTRSSDIVGRYGGDEFAVILPQTPAEGAERFGQRILEFLKDKTVESPNGNIKLGTSIGVSYVENHSFGTNEIPRPVPQSYFQQMAQDAIKQADEMLYQAKRNGGNCVSLGKHIYWPGFEKK